jgi:hypothetical protein
LLEVRIAKSTGQIIAQISIDAGELRCEGVLPDNLRLDDLRKLGFVYYENDARGVPLARVKEVAPSDTVEYLRALNEALPPGYYLAWVKSERIDHEREQHREAFERELAMLEASQEAPGDDPDLIAELRQAAKNR